MNDQDLKDQDFLKGMMVIVIITLLFLLAVIAYNGGSQ